MTQKDIAMTSEKRTALAERSCIPCKGDIPPLEGEILNALYQDLDHEWTLMNEHHLEKQFFFKNFAQALAFTNRVGDIAEDQNHHPDILLSWGKVTVTIWTHKIDGLTESDFVFAAKTENVYN